MDNQLPAEVVEKILRARDSLALNDPDEAYHQLYGIACPNYDSYFPWQAMEAQINYPKVNEQQYNERRQVTEYAKKLHQEQKVLEAYKKDHKINSDLLEAAVTLLEKVASRHEAGLLPDRFIYQEIKTFLDGTK